MHRRLSKHETISYLDESIRRTQADIRYAETVEKIHKQPDLQRFTVTTDKGAYDTAVVVVAIGILGKPNKPDYRLPTSPSRRILFDVTTVEISAADVLVVGGGDSASEYCQYLAQQGNRVALSYRRREFSRMNDINKRSLLALVERQQAEALLESNVESIADEGGKPLVRFKEEAYGSRRFDYVIYALGGTTPRNFLKMIGIEFDGDEPHVKEAGETNVPGLFLIGDLSAGTKGGSIIWAFNSAKTAMNTICRKYLQTGRSPSVIS